MREATVLFAALLDALRAIEADDGREETAASWLFRLMRHHPASDFDRLIEEVAADMGREYLDVVRFRRRFYDRWVEALDALDGEYDFDVEARRLVEHALLTELAAAMPITGKDVIESLGIAPGPAVGEELERALALFSAAPCGRDELLERLRTEEA
jgi:hypothetical protein